jgi:hypothetical protein
LFLAYSPLQLWIAVTMVTSGWYEGESYRVNNFCPTKIDYNLKLCYEWNGKVSFWMFLFKGFFKKKVTP